MQASSLNASAASSHASMAQSIPLQKDSLEESRSLQEAQVVVAPAVEVGEGVGETTQRRPDSAAASAGMEKELAHLLGAQNAAASAMLSVTKPALVNLSTSSTSPLPSVGSPHPKKFSAVNINKKFLEKNQSSSGSSTVSHTPTLKSGGAARTYQTRLPFRMIS